MADNWDEEPTATTSLGDLATTAEPRNRPCLTVMSGGSTGVIHRLVRGPNVIGRAPNAKLRINDDGVSRHHTQVRYDANEAVYVQDLESTNGTYLNGQRITESMPLKAGDKIQIGRTTVLRFAYHDELDESFHENLLSSALRDPMTRLFNKRYLMDRLDSELKFSRRHETAVSVLMLDLDHFKKVNDGHGHLAGDAVLSHVANALLRAVRNEDVVARFGGEEFVIILRAIPIEIAMQLGERLRKLVESLVTTHQGKDIKTSISIGAAGYPSTRAETVEQLLEAADQALYRAKHAGRNRVSR